MVKELAVNGSSAKKGITLSGNYAYVADYDKGLKIIEIQRVISKLGAEDTAIFFNQGEFNFSEGVLTKIKIASLPSHGTLKLSGTAITVNQEINITDLDYLTFEPNLNWNGYTSFNWTGFDGNMYSVNPITASITLSAVNDSPTLSNVSKTGQKDTTMSFSQTDFSLKFNDVDSDSLKKIQILSLPGNGVLKLLNIIVLVNREMLVEDINSLTFEPNPNWKGTTSFSWNGSDGIVYATNPANVNITIINPLNKAPTIDSFSRSGPEDTTINFNQLDFTSKYNDQDGDTLTKIQIINPPNHGALKLSNNPNSPIGVNQEIVTPDLDKLTFVPDPNWNGNTTFSLKAHDGTIYSANPANVDITIDAVEDAPVVSLIAKAGSEDAIVGFSKADFAAGFNDVDGDTLTKIKIMSIPGKGGALKLGNNNVIAGQEMVAQELDNLIFAPELNWYGNTTYTWKGNDGTMYSSNVANIEIGITSVNDLPIIGTITKTGQENEVVTFEAKEFTDKFSDVDGDKLKKVKIVNLPKDGLLKLSGSAVAVNQEIVTESIESLTFEPDSNWSGNTNFDWKGCDSKDYSNKDQVLISIEKDGSGSSYTRKDGNGAAGSSSWIKWGIPTIASLMAIIPDISPKEWWKLE